MPNVKVQMSNILIFGHLSFIWHLDFDILGFTNLHHYLQAFCSGFLFLILF
jgi:hypothetical protein